MKVDVEKTIVISLGGSIVHPYELNIRFLKYFYTFILRWIKRDKRFIIVTGGGSVAREYQRGVGNITQISNEDKDWIGIHATRLNAHLLRTIFRKYADPVVHDNRFKRKKLRHPITVASGWRPGWSTDFVAVQMAVDFGASLFINMGVADFVYTKDYKKYKNAKPLTHLSWSEYKMLIPKKWKPGLHAPVDPIAARLAERKNIKTIIIGPDLKNVDNFLSGKKFKGTVIE